MWSQGAIPPWDGDAELPETLLPHPPDTPPEPWVTSERSFEVRGAGWRGVALTCLGLLVGWYQ